jgi:hypothetical protein
MERIKIYLKEFNSIEDVLEKEYDNLRNKIDKIIDTISADRAKRIAPIGMRYKRDAIDQMIDRGQFYPKFFLDNIKWIHYKKSNLSSVIRDVITRISYSAIDRVINENTIYVSEKDKFHVEGSRAKLSIVSISKTENTLVVEFKKEREEWAINKLVSSIKDKTLIKYENI